MSQDLVTVLSGRVYIPTTVGHFHFFSALFSADHVEQWSRRLKMFDMFSIWLANSSTCLLARRLLLVNWQPARTGSAMRSSCQQR
jgi:hypothetical protein